MLECCEIFRGVPITPLLHDSNTTIFQRGCGSTAECGRAKAETTVRFRSPAPFLSLWCSPDNMPASHAGDHRSEAGQGRQVLFAIYELRFPISVAVHKHLGALLFAKRRSI